MKLLTRCTNMNHGRWNAPVKFCPTCGESINRQASGKCDTAKHAELRKSRYEYCVDCGKQLSRV